MTVFLIFVSFVFPPLGFAADTVNSSDIPDFNASANQFDHLQSPADTPGQPNEGTLRYVNNSDEYADERSRFIAENAAVATYNAGTASNPEIRVNLADYTPDTGSNLTEETITPGEFVNIRNYSYVVSFDNLRFENNNNTYRVDWEVHERPDGGEDGSWIDAIPVVGGLVSAGSELVSAILWIGSIFSVAITNAVISATNIFISLFNVLSFIFAFMFWLLSTYGSVVAGSPNAWVGVFMAIPGIVLSFEFGKLVILLIRTILQGIPFT